MGIAALPGRTDPKDAAVAGPRKHAAQIFAGGCDIHAPQIGNLPDFQMTRADAEAGWLRSFAGNYQGIQVGKPQGKGAAAACVALRILVMVGGLEGADGLAHKRKIAGKRPHCKDQRLLRVVPGTLRMAVGVKQCGGKPAAADNGVPAVDFHHLAPAGGQIHNEGPEIFPDHSVASARGCPSSGNSAISTSSRQSCGQKDTQRPQ